MKHPIFPTLLPVIALFGTTDLRADDHGNTLAAATLISHEDTTGVIDSANDQDWFKLVVTRPGTHWIFTTGGTDTVGTLYNAAGSQITSTGIGGVASNFEISRSLGAGIYYLKITGDNTINGTGAYFLHLRSPDFSRKLTGEIRSGHLQRQGDLHLYEFVSPSDGLHWLYTTGSTNTWAALLEGDGAQITSTSIGGYQNNFLIRRSLAAGFTYFLAIRTGGSTPTTGSYTLHWKNQSTAVPWQGASQTASIHVGGGLNLHQLDIAVAGRCWIYSTGNFDVSATLYDANWNQETATSIGGSLDNFMIERVLPAGRYYILSEAGGSTATGAYALHLAQPATATPVTGMGSTARMISPLGDHDLFVFSTSGGSVTFSTSGSLDTHGTLYEVDGTQITATGIGGVGANFLIQRTLLPGIYYMLVRGSSSSLHQGAYQLNADFPAGAVPPTLSSSSSSVTGPGAATLELAATGSWSVSGLPSWAGVSQTSGSGSAALTFTFAANHSNARREATVMIAGIPHTLVQDPADADGGMPLLTIHPAVILAIQTEVGKSYRIESSKDLSQWSDTGISFVGNGQEISSAIEQTGGAGFFRAVVMD